MTASVLAALTALPAALGLDGTPSPAPTPQIDPSRVTPGYLGLFFFLALGVAVFFLWRSMNHQLKKISFDDGSGDGEGGQDAAAGGRAGGQSDDGSPRR